MTTWKRFAIRVATALPAVAVVTVASALGMAPELLVPVAVFAYTVCFTLQDWLLKDHEDDRAAFLRKSITSNLILVSIIAAIVWVAYIR